MSSNVTLLVGDSLPVAWQPGERPAPGVLLGESSLIREALRLCDIYAPVNSPVVFQGPIGSGKTSLARHLHALSRRQGPFVAVSVGELTETLYADALFGHERGAYTGALGRRRGAFLRAAGGTLLLDDIAVLGFAAQAALLRAVEDRHITPLGGERDIPVTCRLVFATTTPLRRLVDEERFLPDLASRIGELVIELPPLSARRGDIPGLARRFIHDFCVDESLGSPPVMHPETVDALVACDWPRNLRELKGVMERAVLHALADGGRVIRRRHLPPRLFATHAQTVGVIGSRLTKDLVVRLVKECSGNQSEAARRLGVHRNTIRKYLRS